MSALAVLGSVIGLGIAGLDPIGALMVVPAIVAGARRRVVMLFFGTAALVTVATGLALGASIQHLTEWIAGLTIPAAVRWSGQLLLAALLGWWAVHRWAHRADPQPERRSRLVGPVAMGLAGTFWGISAVTDPSFLALAALDSRLSSLPASLAVYTGWFLVSQAPLCLVVLALAAGRDAAPVRRAITIAQRLAAPAAVVLTALLALAALALAVNAATYLVTGAFWPG